MATSSGTSTRRMGPSGSPNWHAMLDGTESILREEGYGALTSRAVADRIGVKQRLVYYYFQTMDDLIVETFRRLASRELDRLQAIGSEDRPLREIWNLCIETTDAQLVSEFIALANRSEGLRAEVIAFVERSRAIQSSALDAAFLRSGNPTGLPPQALSLLATSAALAINREAALGVTTGHEDVLDAIQAVIARLEPGPDAVAIRDQAAAKSR